MLTPQKSLRSLLWNWLPFVSVVAFAAALRLHALDTCKFNHDISRDVTIAQGVREGIHFPVIGAPVMGGGSGMGPLWYYLVAAGMLVWDSVWLLSVLGALNGTLAVACCYVFCKRFFGLPVALISAILYAVSVDDIAWSAHALHPTFSWGFTVGFWYFLVRYVIVRKNWSALAMAAMAACTLNFHNCHWINWLPMLIATFVRWRDGGRVWGLLSLMLFATLTLSPMAMGTGLRFTLGNLESLVCNLFDGSFQQLDLRPFKALFHRLFRCTPRYTGFYLSYATSFQRIVLICAIVWSELMKWFLLACFVGVCLYSWWCWRNKVNIDDPKYAAAVLLWFLLPALGLSVGASFGQLNPENALHYHYFFAAYPAPFIIPGITLGFLWQKSTPSRVAVATYVAVFIGLSLLVRLALVVPISRQTGWWDKANVTLGTQVCIAKDIRQLVNGRRGTLEQGSIPDSDISLEALLHPFEPGILFTCRDGSGEETDERYMVVLKYGPWGRAITNNLYDRAKHVLQRSTYAILVFPPAD